MGNSKLDFMAKASEFTFLGLKTFLDVIEIPKPKKTFWPYGRFNKRRNKISGGKCVVKIVDMR